MKCLALKWYRYQMVYTKWYIPNGIYRILGIAMNDFPTCAPLVIVVSRVMPWPEWMYHKKNNRETSCISEVRTACTVSRISSTASLNNTETKEGNVLFYDALNTLYLRLYGITHMMKNHSDSERGNLLLFPINSKGSFICTIPQPLLNQSWSTGWYEK